MRTQVSVEIWKSFPGTKVLSRETKIRHLLWHSEVKNIPVQSVYVCARDGGGGRKDGKTSSRIQSGD